MSANADVRAGSLFEEVKTKLAELRGKQLSEKKPDTVNEDAMDFISLQSDDEDADTVLSPDPLVVTGQNAKSLNDSTSSVPTVHDLEAETMLQDIDDSSMVAPWRLGRRPFMNENMSLNLHEEILDFCAYISPSAEEHAQRKELLQQYCLLVSELWPEAALIPFGSFITHLYLPQSDIDCVVRGFGNISAVDAIRELASLLKARKLVSYIEEVTKARIPILKFRDKQSGIEFDICFDVPGGEDTSAYVNAQQKLFPSLRPLVLTLKVYLSVRSLNQTFTGGVGSFLLTLMVISYLQLHPGRNENNKHWRTVDQDANLGALLFGFLETYGSSFSYDRTGICLENGGYYFPKALRNKELANPEAPGRMCVLNPIDPDHDVGANSYNIHKVRRAFLYGYQTLASTHLRLHSRDRRSLLGYLFTIPKSFITNRMEKKGEASVHESTMEAAYPTSGKKSKSGNNGVTNKQKKKNSNKNKSKKRKRPDHGVSEEALQQAMMVIEDVPYPPANSLFEAAGFKKKKKPRKKQSTKKNDNPNTQAMKKPSLGKNKSQLNSNEPAKRPSDNRQPQIVPFIPHVLEKTMQPSTNKKKKKGKKKNSGNPFSQPVG